LLDAILSYGLKAHEVYSNGLQTWLDCNPSSHAHAVVQKLKDDHDQNGTAELIRYHKRASADPDSRSQSTSITAMSNMSHHSSRVIEDQRREIAHLQKESELKLITIEEKNIELQRKDAESRLLTLHLRKKELELSDCKQLIKDMDANSEASEMNDIFEKHHSLEQVTSTSQRKTDTQTGEPLLHMGGPHDLSLPSKTGSMGPSHSTGRPTTLPQLPMAGLTEMDHDVSLTPSDVGSYVNVPTYTGKYNMHAGITPSGVNAKLPNRVLTDSMIMPNLIM